MLKNLFLGSTPVSYNDEVIDILRLIRSENVGPKTFLNAIRLFGSAKLALENIGELSVRGGKSKPVKIFSKSDAEKELSDLDKEGAQIISYMSSSYSKLLLKIPDFPPILSYKGNIGLLNQEKCVAIVGARNASINGRTFAAKIAKELVNEGYVVASGLARGIDTAVHQFITANTIAVVAGGIDHIYPPENKKLYQQIADDGLILAELPINTKPLGIHFPQRNRIISGISLGSVIIEASLGSGSLITANFALDQNREVFAVPGFPLDPRCQGTNKLIKEGAHLVESTQDIISNLPDFNILKKNIEDFESKTDSFKHLNQRHYNQINDEMRGVVLALLSATPVDLDDLIRESGMSLQIVYTTLLELELAGKITKSAGNKISLIYKQHFE